MSKIEENNKVKSNNSKKNNSNKINNSNRINKSNKINNSILTSENNKLIINDNSKLIIDKTDKTNNLNNINNSNKLKIIDNLEKNNITDNNNIINLENIDYNDLEYRILSMNINGMKNLFNIIKKNNEKFTLKKEHILINLNKLKKNTLVDIYNLLNFYEQQESKIDSIERNLKNLKK